MKINFKQLTMATALFLGFTGMASADDVLNQSLGATLSATDYFQVTCSNDGGGVPHHIFARVKDKTAGSNTLSVSAQRGLFAKNSTDAVGADANFSPTITVASGANGIYNILVTKTTAAARNYDLQAHCETSGNIHTGTSILIRQNQ